MIDPLQQLESELAGMKPSAVPANVTASIESAIASRRMWWGDWCLACAMSAGALAACVIIVLLTGGSGVPARQTPVIASVQTPRFGDVSVACAESSGDLK